MKKLLKEPLVHFILIGLAIFLIYGLVGESEQDENTIIFNSFDLNNVLTKWEMQWKRPPTEEELKNVIEQNIKQELFYQEALKMNLDHNDEIIKRRLAQKMEFLSNDLVNMQPPSEEDLKAFYQNEIDQYLSDYNYSLNQVLFSYDQRESPQKDAQKVLESIDRFKKSALNGSGDQMAFPSAFENSDAYQIRKTLGNSFVEALKTADTQQWFGPVQSGFGYHLVYIEKRTDPSPIPLDRIKEKVINDYNYKRQRALDSALFKEIKQQYRFDVNLDEDEFDSDIIKLVENTLNQN